MLARRSFIGRVGLGVIGCGVAPSRLTLVADGGAVGNALPRATPESQGVSSTGILSFLKSLEGGPHELHSLMILRHGKVIAEGWWAPYQPEYNHGMYSMSKSFTSTAIGLAVDEERLTVEDKVISFFPKSIPAKISDHLAAMRVKDLLTMSAGQDSSATGKTVAVENWVEAFLGLPVPNAPGSVFNYNSAATYMLSAIVQKVSGDSVLDYLTSRLFKPLGITGPYWETCPRGINTGGWGLHIRTEGLVRFGQLLLQKGVWNGRRIISEEWIAEATSKQIQQPKTEKSNADWVQGYGYQFWRCRHGAYRGDGAFGQFTIVLPEQDAVIVMTGESPSMQGELDLVWEHLLPAFQNTRLIDGGKTSAKLENVLGSLSIPLPEGTKSSAIAKRIDAKSYQIEKNSLGIERVSFRFEGNDCSVTLVGKLGQQVVRCRMGGWKFSEAAVPGTPPRIISGGAPAPGTPARIVAAGAWPKTKQFVMHWRYYETPHHDTVTCDFDGDGVSIGFLDSISKARGRGKDARPIIRGTLSC